MLRVMCRAFVFVLVRVLCPACVFVLVRVYCCCCVMVSCSFVVDVLMLLFWDMRGQSGPIRLKKEKDEGVLALASVCPIC